jgi:hypothetical protein
MIPRSLPAATMTEAPSLVKPTKVDGSTPNASFLKYRYGIKLKNIQVQTQEAQNLWFRLWNTVGEGMIDKISIAKKCESEDTSC